MNECSAAGITKESGTESLPVIMQVACQGGPHIVLLLLDLVEQLGCHIKVPLLGPFLCKRERLQDPLQPLL